MLKNNVRFIIKFYSISNTAIFLIPKVWFLRSKSMVFAFQKYGFCIPKVWFLHSKSMVFAFQKYGFYIPKVWFLHFVQLVLYLKATYIL